MSPLIERVLTKCTLIAVLAALAWFALGCGNDDAQVEEPDAEATIVAAAVRTILEATAEAKANEVPTDTPAPTATPVPPTAVPTRRRHRSRPRLPRRPAAANRWRPCRWMTLKR